MPRDQALLHDLVVRHIIIVEVGACELCRELRH
jgi:hypothetical protein